MGSETSWAKWERESREPDIIGMHGEGVEDKIGLHGTSVGAIWACWQE